MLRLFPALVLFLSLSTASLRTALAQGQNADELDRSIRQVFAAYDSATTPGCMVGVARKGDAPRLRAYGMANLEDGIRLGPESISESGSVAKQFTAAAIALLAADGKLRIDDDVRRWIPEVPELGATITLRHLLNHTSGLRDQWGLLTVAGRPPGRAVHTIPEIIDLVSRQQELNFPPGSRYLYSNTGYTLLAEVVTRVSGMPFARFSAERLFKPLGMTRTQWRDDFRRVVPGRAQAYEKEGGAWMLDMPFTMVHGNGGLLTTVGDLLKWNAALDAGTLGPTITATLETRGKLTDGRTIDYALGLSVLEYRPGLREVSHGGSTAGYRAFLARYPAHDLSVALLCNAADANPGLLAHRVADLFLPPAPPAATAAASPSGASPDSVLARFAGSYRNPENEDQLRFAVRGGQLGVVAGGAGGPLTPAGDARFAGRNGSTFAFEMKGALPMAVTWTTGDGLAERFVRVVTPDATAVPRADYVGRYRSAELDVTVSIDDRDGRLLLRRRPEPALGLVPLYPDGFTMQGQVLRFERDPSGNVTGFRIFAGRVVKLKFDRLP